MFQQNNEVNEAQEVVVYNHDIESETISPTNIRILDDKSKSDHPAAAAVDDAPSKNKKSNYFTGRNVACGLTVLFVVSAGVVAGTGITGAAIADQAVLQSQKNDVATWYPGGKSGKSCKAGNRGQGGDFLECVVQPVVRLAYAATTFSCDDLGEPLSEYDFFKEVWKPYTDECTCFWGKVFYFFYIAVRLIIEKICLIIWCASTKAGEKITGEMAAGKVGNIVDAVSGMSMPESCGWMMSASVYNDFQVQDMDWEMLVSVIRGVSECGGDLWVAMTAAVAGTINANVDEVLSDVIDAVEMVVGTVEEAAQVVGSVIGSCNPGRW